MHAIICLLGYGSATGAGVDVVVGLAVDVVVGAAVGVAAGVMTLVCSHNLLASRASWRWATTQGGVVVVVA